jgi:intraflagellar transport protein 46
MELFRERLNSVIIQNNFFDEALDISHEDSEVELSSRGDWSPARSSNSIEVREQSFDETYHSVVKKLPSCELNGKANMPFERSSKSGADKMQPDRNLEPRPKAHEVKSVVNNEFPNDSESSIKRRLPPNISKKVFSVINLIDDYKPVNHDLKKQFRCFIPSYVPAIGDPDSFLKVPRPDGVPDGLGLIAIDEPAIEQSEISILEQQLKSKIRKRRTGPYDNAVKVVKNASKNPHDIDKWIASMAELHRTRPAPQVLYKQEMPRTEDFMGLLHPDILDALEDESFADALSPELDMTLYEYACLICTMLDMPVTPEDPPNFKKMIYHLHFLFNLYIETYNSNK